MRKESVKGMKILHRIFFLESLITFLTPVCKILFVSCDKNIVISRYFWCRWVDKEDAKAKHRCLGKFIQVNIAVLLICELTDKIFSKATSS